MKSLNLKLDVLKPEMSGGNLSPEKEALGKETS